MRAGRRLGILLCIHDVYRVYVFGGVRLFITFDVRVSFRVTSRRLAIKVVVAVPVSKNTIPDMIG